MFKLMKDSACVGLCLLLGMAVVPMGAAIASDSTTWEGSYEGNALPYNGGAGQWAPYWFAGPGSETSYVTVNPTLGNPSNNFINIDNPNAQWYQAATPISFNFATGASVEWQIKSYYGTANSGQNYFEFGDGTQHARFTFTYPGANPTGSINFGGQNYPFAMDSSIPGNSYHIFRATALGNVVKLYVDYNPVPVLTGTASAGAGDAVNGLTWGDKLMVTDFDYLRWTNAGAFPTVFVPEPEYPGSLSRGFKTLINKGLQIQGLAFPQQDGYFDQARWAESNFTSINLYGYGSDTIQFLGPSPGIPWSRRTRNRDTELAVEEYPYLSNFIGIQLLDEQDMTDPNELAYAATAMASFHAKYPNAIVYTNQYGGRHSTAELQYYMQQVKPDMLNLDVYPFNGSLAGGSPTNLYRYMQQYRLLGLAGNDGAGTQPIPTGLYTQTFQFAPGSHVVSESEIHLNNFAAWAFGFKYVTSFLYENALSDPGILPVMFSGDGTNSPTPQFYQVAETNRQSLNLGPALVRLISTDVRMKMGQHKGGFLNLFDVTNNLPSGVSSWNSSADPYIMNIDATNLGSKNNSLRGDVIIGYFKVLDESFADPGHADDVYFMIVNGLSNGSGSAADCRQLIRIDFDFGTSGIDSLLRLRRDTGGVEEVSLVHINGSQYYLNLYLDGGTGDLFKFNNGGSFVPEPATLSLLTAFICAQFRRRRT